MGCSCGKKECIEGRWWRHPPMRNALISGLVTGTAFVLTYLGILPRSAEIVIYLVAIAIGGYHWMREGVEELIKEREVGIDLLMIAATVGSAVLGMWDEAAFLVFLYGAAEGLEEYTYARTRHSIRQLLDLAPKEARVVREGKEVTIPAGEIRPGEVFIVRPGESIPTDGVIITGRSSVNEAPVTGESVPVEKKKGMKVFAATMNEEGALTIEATAGFEDNTLSRMIHMVEEAQDQKGRVQLFIDRFGKRYTPLVLVFALGLLIAPPMFGLSFAYWAERAVVLLVAAAPCALVMSTPVAIAAGIGLAGRNGVLIKGGVALENLARIRVVAFDKTGTLTRGKPVVTDVVSFNGSESEMLKRACSVERFSEHPLARAIAEKAEASGIEGVEVKRFSSISGYGARAEIDGETVYVGSDKLFARSGRDGVSNGMIEDLRREGKTVIFVGSGEKIDGIIAIRDEIRPRSEEIVSALHRMRIKVVMLTGDNETSAEAVARELNIDKVRAGLKPEEKIRVVRELEEEYGAVAMVGDGINDAPALAGATLGIAMGAAGTDAAVEAADIALMGDDLGRILYAVRLGKKSGRISRQNIVFAISTLAVLIPAALTGWMSIAVAVIFHEASELIAVANGLRVAREGD
ncbi:MAG: cadmium-translocating P-type ATPase [Deltaproteobacteria bacterium]|nr:cadmium-translocating P-type ATPase [Deltaproteobacteria bacterium]